MLSFRSLIAFVLLSACLFGCANRSSNQTRTSPKYYRVTISNYRGEFVSDWIAEGPVVRTPLGYRFRAVERDTAPPYPQGIHYPDGRSVEITGPNLIVRPCGQPLWLYQERRGW